MKVKHSLAVLIRRSGKALIVRRPDDDDELPGIWGIPAGTFRGAESAQELIARIGRDKLGAGLVAIQLLGSGSRVRPTYVLEMDLWEAAMEGEPRHPAWRWAPVSSLLEGARAGSLCCALALENENRVSS